MPIPAANPRSRRRASCSVRDNLPSWNLRFYRYHPQISGPPLAGRPAICGDPLYLPPQAKATETPCKPERMLLHAWHLGFEHPITREYLDVYAPDRQVFAPFIRLNATILDAPGAASDAPTGQ